MAGAWDIAVTVIIFIALMMIVEFVAAPAISASETIQQNNDLDTAQYDGDKLVKGLFDSFYFGIRIAIVGMMAWGIARVVRRERRIGGNGGGRI